MLRAILDIFRSYFLTSSSKAEISPRLADCTSSVSGSEMQVVQSLKSAVAVGTAIVCSMTAPLRNAFVTHSADSLEVNWVRSIRLEFLAQFKNVIVYRTSAWIVVIARYFMHQLVPRVNALGVLDEEFQYLELHCRYSDKPVASVTF